MPGLHGGHALPGGFVHDLAGPSQRIGGLLAVYDRQVHDRAECLQGRAFEKRQAAVEAPMRTLLANAGHSAGKILARLAQKEPGHGLDTATGQIVDMANLGILDVASVQKKVVSSAVSGAALALTTDVLVHHRKPQVSMDP